MYEGHEHADTDLLDQPRDFAYKLKGQLEKEYDQADQELPPLYFAGWLPNVSPERRREHRCRGGRRQGVARRHARRQNVPRPHPEIEKPHPRHCHRGAPSLEHFSNLFGTTSGLRRASSPRPTQFASMGHLIDRKNLALKRLTKEQEDLAFNPNLVRGPKVVRGVAGGGKTIVLANAVAETFLRALAVKSKASPLPGTGDDVVPNILVLCFNRVLVPYISVLIRECFNARKPNSAWTLPASNLKVMNIDRYAYWLCRQAEIDYDPKRTAAIVGEMLQAGVEGRGENIIMSFIDEGQDIDMDWYPLIRMVTRDADEADLGKSIVVFYDEAQKPLRQGACPARPTCRRGREFFWVRCRTRVACTRSCASATATRTRY